MVATQTKLDMVALAAKYSQTTPREILKFALETF
ncbi:MAG TPA: phosphoadenosine phosphosulfate reductase, partial [Microcoleaceae bacterium UBA11344]|nr:phosphoadenosine phosphosulfate reductase [Microcoleaceae cyanobacterium UBA11344]